MKTCMIEKCNRISTRRRMCNAHYLKVLKIKKTDESTYHKRKGDSNACIICKDDVRTNDIVCSLHVRSLNRLINDNRKSLNRKCLLFSCNNKNYINGLCKIHIRRLRKHGSTDKYTPPVKICSFKNCKRLYYGKGYCSKHYQRIVNPPARSYDIETEIHMKNVKARDRFTCQWLNCGKTTKDSPIHAHHIFPINEYPELVNVEKYMICYCNYHHSLFHQYRGDRYYKFIGSNVRREEVIEI